MPSYDAGAAQGRYLLDISDAERKAAQLRSIFAGLKQDAATFGAQTRALPQPRTASPDQTIRANQRLIDSAVRAATAQRDYTRALSLVDQELRRASPNTERYNNLLARQATLSRQAAQSSAAQSAALPRTFAGVTGQGLAQLAGGLGITVGIQQVTQFTLAAGELNRETTKAQNSLRALAGSTEFYGEALAAAREQQRLFGGSLASNIDGITGLVTVSRSSGVELNALIDLAQRLSIKDPSQGIAGARIALNEALSGDPTSLARRYEIPRAALRALRDESTTGAQKLQILDQYLNNIGITSGVVAESIPKETIALNEQNQQLERATIAFGEIISKAQAAGAVLLTQGIKIGDQRINIGAFADGLELAAAANRAFNDSIQRGESVAIATIRAQQVLVEGNVNYGRTTKEATTATDIYSVAVREAAKRSEALLAAEDAATAALIKNIQAKQQQQIVDQQQREVSDQLAAAALRAASGQSSEADEVARLTRLFPAMADAIPGLIDQQLKLAGAADAAAAALGRQRIEGQRLAKGATDQSGAIGFDSPGRRGTDDVDAVVAQIERNKQEAAEEEKAQAEAERNLRFQRATQAERVKLLRQEVNELRRRGAAQSEILNKQAELEQAEDALAKSLNKGADSRAKASATAQDQIENRLEDSYRKQLQLQEDYQLRAARSQEDFDTRRSRSTEDYQRQRRRLLAEGKIFEAQQLKEEFERTQAREQEDFTRQQARARQDEQLRRAREQADAGIDTSRIQDRAAIRGVAVPGVGAAGVGDIVPLGNPQPVGAGGQTIIVQLTGSVNLDGQKVGDLIFPTVEEKFVNGIIQVQVSSAPQSAPNPLAGPRP